MNKISTRKLTKQNVSLVLTIPKDFADDNNLTNKNYLDIYRAKIDDSDVLVIKVSAKVGQNKLI